ncbi:MAG TPA: PBS lyase, partial [Clostridia bacterium]|nr:PBS lyase [Clostridia bacterium]
MQRIKLKILMLLLLVMVGSQFAVANEIAAMWTRLYERARTLDQKQQIMMNIVEQHSRDVIPVLNDALDEEVRTFRNTANVTEAGRKIELMKMV